jgi:hypothetical protein
MWSTFGLYDIVEHAMQSDLAGSDILEILLWEQSGSLQGFTNIGRKEIISTVCWYLWWIRCRRTHNELVRPVFKCKMSILAIVANASRAAKPPRYVKDRWEKPGPRQLKLNVDAAFHPDVFFGAVGWSFGITKVIYHSFLQILTTCGFCNDG